jgi:hypothetical protein
LSAVARLNFADADVETCRPQMITGAPQRMVVVANLLGCFEGQDIVARNQDGLAG